MAELGHEGMGGNLRMVGQSGPQHICHKMLLGTSAHLPLPAVMVRPVAGNCRDIIFCSVRPGFPVILMETIVCLK